MKIQTFKTKSGYSLAIDTKEFRYFFFSIFKIEKFPIHYLDEDVLMGKNKNLKELMNLNIKTFLLLKFWKGFHYAFDVLQKFDMLFNKIELLEEDVECIHKYLDDLKVPRKYNEEQLSIVGRIKYMKELCL